MSVSCDYNGSEENLLDTSQMLLNDIVDSYYESTNTNDHLAMMEKGNIKWNGSFEGLKDFLNDQQLLVSTANWTSRGGARLCETEDLTIRWYATNNSLTLKGKKADEVKAKLVKIIEKDKISKSNLSYPTIMADSFMHSCNSRSHYSRGKRRFA